MLVKLVYTGSVNESEGTKIDGRNGSNLTIVTFFRSPRTATEKSDPNGNGSSWRYVYDLYTLD